MVKQINRRSAIAGMGATIVGVAAADDVVASVERTGAGTVETQLNELAVKFIEAAKIIDPSIKGGWCGRYVEVDDQRLFQIYLERDKQPFVRQPNT